MTAPAEHPGGVTILLSTYNGQAFLRAQLDSLRSQSWPDWRLLWRDDGSTDASVEIMRAFADSLPDDSCVRVDGPAGRLGPAGAYHALAVAAGPGHVAFCDQDDVWLPDKLARAHAALDRVPAGTPAMYCGRQTLVDASLRRLGTSPRLQPTVFPMTLTQNVATGCTVMLNPAGSALLRAAAPPGGTLHDWWSCLLVSGAGGEIIVDDEPAILYRQHGGNAIGAPQNEFRRAVAALRRGPGVFMRVFRDHVAALGTHQALLSPAANQAVAAIDAALRSGMQTRLRVLRHYRLRRQTRRETALFILWFLIG